MNNKRRNVSVPGLNCGLVQVDVLEFDPERDSLDHITSLLNRAYGRLAAMGLNYVAATQDSKKTADRIRWAKTCWLAYQSKNLVATICYYTRTVFAVEPPWHQREDVSHFGQFAVEPALQGAGIGSALLAAVEQQARRDGKKELSCDTATEATHLVAFYEKRGFRIVGRHWWPHADYESFILSKAL
jgi:GNAT superfamily N-acetyltransferase